MRAADESQEHNVNGWPMECRRMQCFAANATDLCFYMKLVGSVAVKYRAEINVFKSGASEEHSKMQTVLIWTECRMGKLLARNEHIFLIAPRCNTDMFYWMCLPR